MTSQGMPSKDNTPIWPDILGLDMLWPGIYGADSSFLAFESKLKCRGPKYANPTENEFLGGIVSPTVAKLVWKFGKTVRRLRLPLSEFYRKICELGSLNGKGSV